MTELIEKIACAISAPEKAYREAEKIVGQIEGFLRREGSALEPWQVGVRIRGAFTLGLVARPLNPNDPYHLDLSCEAGPGADDSPGDRQPLAEKIGQELEAFRKAEKISKPLLVGPDSWSLELARGGRMNFRVHLELGKGSGDEGTKRGAAGENSIVDAGFHSYADWFESRMSPAEVPSAIQNFEETPMRLKRTPLQFAIILLKRHRDKTFEEGPDLKPGPILITTLAAKAYSREPSLDSALFDVLEKIDDFVSDASYGVPHPVRPGEYIEITDGFQEWLERAREDFIALREDGDLERIKHMFPETFMNDCAGDPG